MSRSLLFVTGLSGAGMSSAMNALEDTGYEVFDNFPLFLLDELLIGLDKNVPVAIGFDTRTRGFSAGAILEKLEAHKEAELLFLDCDHDVLIKRFSETRRRHPLAKDKPIVAGISQEREQLAHLRDEASVVIDTSALSIHDLKAQIESQYALHEKAKLLITVMSFGFKNGVPRGADMVLDVRFFKNPHWQENLRPLSGHDRAVVEHIQGDTLYADFTQKIQELLGMLLPRYKEEGKSYFTLAFGCTGGRHRSVHMAENFTKFLTQKGWAVAQQHRDLT